MVTDLIPVPKLDIIRRYCYGIIEDVGGTGALEQYNYDYQKGQVDPGLKGVVRRLLNQS